MKNVMVDLETLGTNMDSQILTIGAIAFDRDTFETQEEFYRRVDIKSCEDLGLTKTEDTVRFWEKQPSEAKDEAFNPNNRVSISDAMFDFAEFIKRNRCDEFWCNGANFDEPILSTVFDKLHFEKPWKFWKVRCLRTALSLHRKNMRMFGQVAHHALDDCKKQIAALKSLA
jgi:DNA polymerase III epsilon subunit-like protein